MNIYSGMQRFSRMVQSLDETTSTNAKVDALADYFREAGERDKLWTIALLSQKRPKRTVNTTLLREWASDAADIPLWLFEESYHVVGDLAESIALVTPDTDQSSEKSLADWIQYIRSLEDENESLKKEKIQSAWRQLDAGERFVFNKLITGAFRIGVSQKLMTRALSKATDIDENTLAHRLMGNWSPDETTFEALVLTEDLEENLSRPYPFFLAYAVEEEVEQLGPPSEWHAERKWDGIRGQIVKRGGTLYVWSRGEELVTDRFPEYDPLRKELPDGVVIDGEILPFRDGRPLHFQKLQKRIGRKNITGKILDEAPVIMKAYDLLEWRGEDIRDQPLIIRKKYLKKVVNEAHEVLQLSEEVEFDRWEDLREEWDRSREHFTEGMMLKKKDSVYKTGRRKGDWWKWKIDPLCVDGVLLYAKRGHGRRANLYTDYTFTVWDGDELIPFAKAYSGLTDDEFEEITRFVQRNTLERYGPVRAVEPQLVFEIAFEGINRSKRHKSGISLRFPRIKRWRKDKHPKEANTLEDLHRLLEMYGPREG